MKPGLPTPPSRASPIEPMSPPASSVTILVARKACSKPPCAKVLGELGKGIAQRRSRAERTPRGQIRAIIDGNFDGHQVSQSVMKTWLAFWASSMHRGNLQRLQRVNDRRLYSNLCFQFRRCLPRQDARDAARGLAALIDGLWLRGALASETLDVERARRIAYDYLDGQLQGADTFA